MPKGFHHAVALEEARRAIAFTIHPPDVDRTPMLEKEAQDDAPLSAFAGASMMPKQVAEVILKSMRPRILRCFSRPNAERCFEPSVSIRRFAPWSSGIEILEQSVWQSVGRRTHSPHARRGWLIAHK